MSKRVYMASIKQNIIALVTLSQNEGSPPPSVVWMEGSGQILDSTFQVSEDGREVANQLTLFRYLINHVAPSGIYLINQLNLFRYLIDQLAILRNLIN